MTSDITRSEAEQEFQKLWLRSPLPAIQRIELIRQARRDAEKRARGL